MSDYVMLYHTLKKRKVNGVLWVFCRNINDFNAMILFNKETEYALYAGDGFRGKNWYFVSVDGSRNRPILYDFTLSEVKGEYNTVLSALENLDSETWRFA